MSKHIKPEPELVTANGPLVITDMEPAPAALVDITAIKAALKAELLAEIAKEAEGKTDPGFSRPGVRTVTQEAIAQTKVVSGTEDMNAPAVPKAQTTMDNGTIRQDF